MSGKLLLPTMALSAFVTFACLAFGPVVDAQEKVSPGETQAQNVEAYVDLLRHDVQKQKVAITSQLMQLSPEQAATFWPIYSEYAKELSALGDLRLRGIKQYINNYSSLSDQMATELANIRFDYDRRLLALKKKYFDQLSKALTPKLAARFFQIENQLLDILDLQIASRLPVVE